MTPEQIALYHSTDPVLNLSVNDTVKLMTLLTEFGFVVGKAWIEPRSSENFGQLEVVPLDKASAEGFDPLQPYYITFAIETNRTTAGYLYRLFLRNGAEVMVRRLFDEHVCRDEMTAEEKDLAWFKSLTSHPEVAEVIKKVFKL